MSDPTPHRVRVSSPRMRAARRGASHPVTRDIDEQTDVGAVYMRSLVRSQLRLAAMVLLLVAVSLGALPLLFLYVPSTATMRVASIPLPWLVLGVLVYPFVIAVAHLYVRAAERVEREFSTTLERAGRDA